MILKKMISKWVEIGSFIFKISQFINPKTKLYHITTDSKHGFYKSKDLLADLEIKHAEQVLSAI
jgi:hypothetical protein